MICNVIAGRWPINGRGHNVDNFVKLDAARGHHVVAALSYVVGLVSGPTASNYRDQSATLQLATSMQSMTERSCSRPPTAGLAIATASGRPLPPDRSGRPDPGRSHRLPPLAASGADAPSLRGSARPFRAQLT